MLLSKLNDKKIDKIRQHFNVHPEIKQSEFFQLINRLLPPREQLSAKTCDVLFRKIDANENGAVNAIEFLDYLLHECRERQGYYNDKIGFINSSTFHAINYHKHMGVDHIQIIKSGLKDSGSIRKIHHLDVSSRDPNMSDNEKRGLYVTVIGKRSLGFWKPDLTMITDAMSYSSKEIPAYSSGISPALKRSLRLKPDKMEGREARRAIEKYDQHLPEFDIVCMGDFQLIACFQILHRTLLFYDVKLLKLRCSITDLPVEVSCADYVSNKKDEVSRLLLGSATGGFLILEFASSIKMFTEFRRNFAMQYKFSDIPSSEIRVHHVRCHQGGYVTKINFFDYKLNEQNLILTSSLFDVEHPKTCNTLAATEFKVGKLRPRFIEKILSTTHFPLIDSVNTFATAGDGILVTGGWDSHVRVWYLSELERNEQHCHAELHGHRTAIIGVHYHLVYCQIISMSIDGVINIWNYLDRSITQTFTCTHLMPCLYRYINSYVPKLPDIPPAFYFCTDTESILLGEESIIVIPFGDVTKEEHLTAL